MTTETQVLDFNALVNSIEQEAQQSVNMNEASSGGFEQTVLESGNYLGAMVEYVDLGEQEDVFQGQSKGFFPKVRLGFAVFGYVDDGAGGLKMDVDNPVIIRETLFLKRNEKANAYKAFRALNVANDPKITHFAQFFMKPFMFKVVKKQNKDKTRYYNLIELTATVPAVDGMTRQPYQLPKIDDKFKVVFLWNNPIKEMWDKLYIDGTRDDGSSKNFIQDEIASAANFHGSAVEAMLGGSELPIPTATQAAPTPPTPQPVPQPVPTPQAPTQAAPQPTPTPPVPQPPMPSLAQEVAALDDDIPF